MQQENAENVIRIFSCHAPKDKRLSDHFIEHLSTLKYSKEHIEWLDLEIKAGMDWENDIQTPLVHADIILLQVSPSSLFSSMSYSLQMQQVLERQRDKGVMIIPVLLRPTLWQETPLGELQSLPKNGKPITLWNNRDAAFFTVVTEIKAALRELRGETKKNVRVQD